MEPQNTTTPVAGNSSIGNVTTPNSSASNSENGGGIADVILKAVFVVLLIAFISFGLVFWLRPQWLGIKPANTETTSVTEDLQLMSPITKNSEFQETRPPEDNAVTPAPLQGPGKYACSALGGCKDWADAERNENCTVTYADSKCLGQCEDVTKRCKI